MGADEIRNKIAEELYGKLCNDLPRGIEYGGPEDGEELIVTDDDGETEYQVEIDVILMQTKPEPEWVRKLRKSRPIVDGPAL
jgi:hypothetical protein